MSAFEQYLPKINNQLRQGIFSKFKISGSAGMDFEGSGKVLTVGATAQKFEIQNLHTGEKRWLGFIGVGVGVSHGNSAGGSISLSNFPSNGTQIVMGLRQWGSSFDWTDLEGNTFIYSASGGVGVRNIGVGVSSALIMFNYAVSEYYSYGIGLLEGLAVATNGVGLINFTGITKYI